VFAYVGLPENPGGLMPGVVLVHGGGPDISRRLREEKIETRFVDGSEQIADIINLWERDMETCEVIGIVSKDSDSEVFIEYTNKFNNKKMVMDRIYNYELYKRNLKIYSGIKSLVGNKKHHRKELKSSND